MAEKGVGDLAAMLNNLAMGESRQRQSLEEPVDLPLTVALESGHSQSSASQISNPPFPHTSLFL